MVNKQRKERLTMDRIRNVIILAVGIIVSTWLVGCGSTTGFNVGLYATPVTQIDYNQKLEPRGRIARK
jgi:hypothetical protein